MLNNRILEPDTPFHWTLPCGYELEKLRFGVIPLLAAERHGNRNTV